eukprot:gb/GFBE01027443.1/.p1 GENE.gb/GFBE01027443.1/~~gb/GFBE01027443.1/.p1  ORF type:complete len:715 (+),score=114.20 gb/GFBE01027443.1/:1-2145(+)
MHGLIHVVFKEFIVEKFDVATWLAVLKECGLQDDTAIMELKQYADDLTLATINAGVGVLGISLEVGLELFGSFFVRYLSRQGWTTMLQSMGNSLKEFIDNLNEMHHFLERDFRSSIFPFFATRHDDSGNLLLTYSSRRFLPGLVRGILKEIALIIFQVKADLVEIQTDGRSCVTWHVVQQPALPAEAAAEPSTSSGFSFFQIHEALASLCRAPACGLQSSCCSVQAEEHEELVIVAGSEPSLHGADVEMKSESSPRVLAPVPSHGSMPGSPHSFVGDISWPELQESKPISSAQIREDFAIPDALNLTEWLGNQNSDRRLELAQKLYRGVPACKVACHWYELGGLATSQTDFWDPQNREENFYTWSECRREESANDWPDDLSDSPDVPFRFVSHSWWPPQDWHAVMGEKCSYADIKAAELCIAAKDLCADSLHDASRWEEAHFWIDKCCIKQGDQELMSLSIHLIEEFIQLCDGMIVIFTWSYFNRLWCVYEWACFLVFHEPENLLICADSFYREATEDRFLEAVRNFSVDQCQCSDQRDRDILEQKIKAYYGCRKNFERFLRVSVIAITARSLAARGARSKLGLGKWVALACELGFDHLAEGLRMANPVAWRRTVLEGKTKSLTQDFQTGIKQQSDAWFENVITPILTAERKRAVQEHIYTDMIVRKHSIKKALTDNDFKRQITATRSAERMTQHKSAPTVMFPAVQQWPSDGS